MLNARYYKSEIILTLFLLSAISFANANASGIVTVTTTDGDVYKDVTYKVNSYYKTVKLEKEGFEKNVSFSKIESIVDKDGTDITDRILGRYTRTEEKQWVSRDSEKFKNANTRPWQAVAKLGLNFSIPFGDYYEGIGSGVGFEGDMRFAFTKHLAVRAGISKSGMRSTEDPVFYSLSPVVEVVDTEFRINAYRYYLGAEYYAKAVSGDNTGDYLFLISYLGAIDHKTELEVTLENIVTHEQITETSKYSESKFLFGVGFGLTKLLGKNYGFEAGLTFDFVPVGSRSSSLYGKETVYAYIIDFKLGLVGFIL